MSVNSEMAGESATPVRAAWGAVVAMAFGVFVLVSAEFLPVSLLTPMAASLHVTEGLAGQTITATALVALLASLATAQVTRGRDRRGVMLIFFVLLIASCLLVTFAVNLPMILAARVLLGMAIGGFWTLSTAMAMRLVAPWQVPRALSIVFSGVSLATVFAAPLGSYLGGLLGWRDTFLLAAMLSGVSLVWLFFSLPSLPAEEKSAEGGAMNLLRRPVMRWGLLAVMLLFTGHFAFFTYLRPYLETGVGFNLNQLSLVLLGFGIANFFGTSLAKEAGCSRSVFAGRFQQATGMTPLRYLTELRMRLATERLNKGHAVEKVAFDLGYGSLAAFSRAFKRTVGHSPGALRTPRELAAP